MVTNREDMIPEISGQDQTKGNKVSYRGHIHTNHVTTEGTGKPLFFWLSGHHLHTAPHGRPKNKFKSLIKLLFFLLLSSDAEK